MNISILVFTGLVPVDSVSAGCANFCVLSEYDIGKVTGDLTGKIPQTLHVIGCLRSPVDLLKSVGDQENILVNHIMYVDKLNAVKEVVVVVVFSSQPLSRYIIHFFSTPTQIKTSSHRD